MTLSRPAKGFTLLEVLVAVAILAMSITLIYQAMGSGASAIYKVTQQHKAIVLAESLLASRDWVAPQGWNETGQSGGISWKAISAPYPTPVSQTGAPNMVRLHKVGLTLQWLDAGTPQTLELITLLPEGRPLPGETIP